MSLLGCYSGLSGFGNLAYLPRTSFQASASALKACCVTISQKGASASECRPVRGYLPPAISSALRPLSGSTAQFQTRWLS